MYLRITNPGQCPIEGFTKLGWSSARGNADKIGKYGSGLKHGINLCLRKGLAIVAYTGTTELTYTLKPDMVAGTKINRVFINVDGVSQELGWSLEFGELDWDCIDMALREIISNALDQSGNNAAKVKMEIVQSPIGVNGYTSIYVPFTPEVGAYYLQLKEKFLQFTNRHEQKILDKPKGSELSLPKVYRKGVYVRTVHSGDNNKTSSLYDYNFNDELPIDECRNLDNYKAERAIYGALRDNEEAMRTLFGMIIRRETCYELEHGQCWYLSSIKAREFWPKIWDEVSNGAKIVSKEMAQFVSNKGIRSVIILNSNWYEAMVGNGIPVAIAGLNAAEKNGGQIVRTTKNARQNLRQVWSKLTRLGLTDGKTCPRLAVFVKPMNAGSTLGGYYENGTVYIEQSHETDRKIMLEECAHYITGATDNVRDFQDFAFKCATMAMFKSLTQEKV